MYHKAQVISINEHRMFFLACDYPTRNWLYFNYIPQNKNSEALINSCLDGYYAIKIRGKLTYLNHKKLQKEGDSFSSPGLQVVCFGDLKIER